MNGKVGIELLQEMLEQGHLPFRVTSSDDWKGVCPVSKMPHEEGTSIVCLACRKIHVLERHLSQLTLETVGACVVFIGIKYHKRKISNAQ